MVKSVPWEELMHREAKTFHKKQPVWLSETVGHKITVRFSLITRNSRITD